MCNPANAPLHFLGLFNTIPPILLRLFIEQDEWVMLTLENEEVRVDVSEDGCVVSLTDRVRGCRWSLDRELTGYCRGEEDEQLTPLPKGKAERRGEAIAITHFLDEGEVTFLWTLRDDHAEVRLETQIEDISRIALPGALRPDDGPADIAVPLYQGLLIRHSAKTWRRWVSHSGHVGFTMSMAAVIAERGALLVTHDSHSNWRAMFGEDIGGPFTLFAQLRYPVDGWRDAVVRLYPVDADLTTICKRYRARVIERGEFLPWAEKIERKPIVKDLFGCVFAFAGYNKTSEIDYVASTRKLKSHGFDSIFLYPTRMCHYSLDFKMGGDDPIWLSDEEIAAIKSVEGAHVSPWAWVVEGLDDGSEAMRAIFKKGPDGQPIPNWQIDEQRWYLVCTPYQVEHVKQRLAGDMTAMDWLHFDVNAVWAGRRCFDAGHALHDSRPMGCLGDMEWTRRLFSPETVANRIVSSEGFNDHYAGYYDIGSTKMMPPSAWVPGCVPVPMTMLVFHDSCVHNWWEMDTYNAHPGFGLSDAPHGLGRTGSGLPELKAAMDALHGCPPNLFPFGKQYGWVDIATRESYSYIVRLEDESVRTALRAALPVAQLHKAIGMEEMVSFEFLSEDRAVQATAFADGTRIVANLSEQEAEAPDVGTLPPHSWRRL